MSSLYIVWIAMTADSGRHWGVLWSNFRFLSGFWMCMLTNVGDGWMRIFFVDVDVEYALNDGSSSNLDDDEYTLFIPGMFIYSVRI